MSEQSTDLTVDVLVIGAGPAGLAAAEAAANQGVRVAVADESYRAGGQYLRPRASAPQPVAAVRAAEAAGVEFLLGNPVWHVDTINRVTMVGQETVRWGALVLATGAFDRTLPVVGAMLPGVMTAGAAQTLAKEGVRLGDRVLVAGSGPFAFPVAEEVIRSGGGIAEVALSHLPLMLAAGVHEPRVVVEAAHFARVFATHRVQVRSGWVLTSVLGDADGVRGAVLTKGNRTRTVDCDAVAMGYGFLPQLAIADIAGCALRFDQVHQTWFVAVDEDLRTSIPGIFAAGESTGIGGHRKAGAQGRLAGFLAAREVGTTVSVPPAVRRSARRMERFARAAAAHLSPPADLPRPAEDAIVCRCESVPVSAVRTAVADGATTVSGVRTRTRLGMGPCQGRMCAQNCAALIALQADNDVESAGRVRGRTPARPVPLGELGR